MGDVVRFFSIMGILFFAFTMCLMFIMGDVYPEFHNPITAGITLFRALLGDLDFEATIKEDDETTNEALIYWGFFLMLLYLVIGSLVLLNLLVAIMAKTFDTIEETTRQSITFAKFKLAMNKDRTASFMPPPYNVIAFALIVLFYAIEYCINIVKRLLYCCRKNKKFIRFDLAVRLMPPFMRRRQLELDEQIVFENCQRRWIITTNKGTKWGKFVKYEAEIMHHYVQFTDEVSVQNSVLKKKEWKLDAFDLYREGLLDMKQFEINVTEKYTNEAHESMKSQWCKSNDQKRQSQYWICGFCRGYVKASKISTKKLAFMLRVHPMEMKIVNQLSPEICPNCYRTRLERKRWELVCEITAYWLFMILIWWILILIFGFLLTLTLLADPERLEETFTKLKKKLSTTNQKDSEAIPKDELLINSNNNDDLQKSNHDHNEDNKLNNESDNCNNSTNNNDHDHHEPIRHVCYHYKCSQLISNLNEMDRDCIMFDDKHESEVWKLLYTAKQRIDYALLEQKINEFIMLFADEDELTEFEFYDDFVRKSALINHQINIKDGDTNDMEIWKNYFKPLAKTLFDEIKDLSKDQLPLHLFGRYPLDITLVQDDFQQFFKQQAEENELVHKGLDELMIDDIVCALEELKFLNCRDNKERIEIITYIRHHDNVWKYDDNGVISSLYPRFTKYVNEIHSLFHDTRKIKNMLRDVSNAIIERG
eukprot:505593_1